nr:hypothetical protein [Tanacetum cinerariifolium]
KDVSNDLNLSSKRNAELNVGRFSRIKLRIVVGGIGASPNVVIVAIVEGFIIGVIALAGCLPLAVVDSLEADTTVVVGVGVGRVVEEAKSPFFFLALAFGFGAASPVAQA